QGAPTSPALANLCAYRMDCRLAGLARAVGAAYTRYADDLAFSGGDELARAARRAQVLVGRVALAAGFEVHMRTSGFMRQVVRQRDRRSRHFVGRGIPSRRQEIAAQRTEE